MLNDCGHWPYTSGRSVGLYTGVCVVNSGTVLGTVQKYTEKLSYHQIIFYAHKFTFINLCGIDKETNCTEQTSPVITHPL